MFVSIFSWGHAAKVENVQLPIEYEISHEQITEINMLINIRAINSTACVFVKHQLIEILDNKSTLHNKYHY